MKISLNWLSDYIELDNSAEEIAEMLTMAGLEVTSVSSGGDYEGIVVGEVVDCVKHPNADKLSLCTLNVGEDESLSIVCGAPNVEKSQKVAVALVGATLPDGLKIKKAKIRGEESRGMICSEKELGLSDEADGILVLPKSSLIGSPLSDTIEPSDTVFELDLTPNRPDGLSHIGVARDLSAILGKDLKYPEIKLKESNDKTSSSVTLQIDDKEGCPRFACRVIKDIKINESPQWLKQRLQSVGLRSINNVVDAANYVLMELGNPIHTFDLDLLKDNKIIVRAAGKDEEVTTLDGTKRKLSEGTVLVCDAEKPVGIGGIMGMANSEVTDKTVNLLIECAYFDPGRIRSSSKHLGLSTDASKRFERGCDPNNIEFTLNRITSIILDTAGGNALQGIVDIYPDKIDKIKIHVRYKRVCDIIGMDIPEDKIKDILNRLEYETISDDEESITLLAPTFRPDVEREIDIIEEIARIIGYDNIPPSEYARISLSRSKDSTESLNIKLKNIFVGLGFTEIYTNSLMPQNLWELAGEGGEPVKISNPISLEMQYLRSSLMPRLLETVQYNFNRQRDGVRFFEDGVVAVADDKSETGVKETHKFGAIVSGIQSVLNWSNKPEKADFFVLKGLLESLLYSCGYAQVTLEPSSKEYMEDSYTISADNVELGVIGEISNEVIKKFDLEDKVYYFELNVDPLYVQIKKEVTFSEPSKYPQIERDISFIVDDKVSSGELMGIVGKEGGGLLESSLISSVYKGKPLAEGEKSITYNLRFISYDRTLEEVEIDSICNKIMEAAGKSVGAKIRD
ncbi:MAG: phenylalanine--tRNA ligase subunit beta [Candidatus Marinimicrobia bacterium]|nr:phenylalanine--tRNA ligase subunit beta [Candidatus Neomarinimicrobiota bacterium]